MPTNLNALLRYKTIDSCLSNHQINCSIELLIQRCSQALTENIGQTQSVSERTIRNDIRILRSDILGFNAPIIFENGRYYYEENDYTIFGKSINEMKLLKNILELLIENFEQLNRNENLYILMKELSEITKQKIPSSCKPKTPDIFPIKMEAYKPTPLSAEAYSNELYLYFRELKLRSKRTSPAKKLKQLFTRQTNKKEYLKWEYVFRVI